VVSLRWCTYPGVTVHEAYPGVTVREAYPGVYTTVGAYPGVYTTVGAYPGVTGVPQVYPGVTGVPQVYPREGGYPIYTREAYTRGLSLFHRVLAWFMLSFMLKTELFLGVYAQNGVIPASKEALNRLKPLLTGITVLTGNNSPERE